MSDGIKGKFKQRRPSLQQCEEGLLCLYDFFI